MEPRRDARAGRSSTTRHRRFAAALGALGRCRAGPSLPHDDVDAACRARVEALGEAGLLDAVVPAAHGGLHPTARRAHALPRPRDPGLPRRPRRLRLRHAGARHRLDLAVRLARAEGALPAAGARRAARSPPSPCPSRRPARTSRRWRRRPRRTAPSHRPHRRRARPGSRTAASPTTTWCSRAPAKAPGAKGLSAFVVDADTPGPAGRPSASR